MNNGLSTMTLDQLLTAALTGQRYNQRRLYEQAKLYARRISCRRALGLPFDLHDEVLQEAFAQLWQKKASALTDMTAIKAFRKSVLKAVRAVKAAYAEPGTRTRDYKNSSPRKIAAEHVGFIYPSKNLTAPANAEAAETSTTSDAVTCPGAAASWAATEARMDAKVLLALAPPLVQAALELIYLDATPKQEVAAFLKISRFALTRKIDAFCETWRPAA